MRVATWNINSVRARKERLLTWLSEHQPDVLCLQETKVVDGEFPFADLSRVGYQAIAFGQKTYNGVALVARSGFSSVVRGLDDDCDDPQCRLLSAQVGGVRVITAYVPNGQTLESDKYTYKLAWLERLRRYLVRTAQPHEPLVICGDFNVAPRASDAAHPEAWEDSVLFHASSREALAKVVSWGLVDVVAQKHPDGGVYSWWDYRMLAFPRNDGLRIDLILATAPLAAQCQSAWVDREARKGKQPSDHAPVLAEFAMPTLPA